MEEGAVPCEKGQLSLHPSWKGGLDPSMLLEEDQRSQGMVTKWQDALTQFKKSKHIHRWQRAHEEQRVTGTFLACFQQS